MKKLFTLILTLTITGCVSTAQPVKPPVVEPIKTHIMYYWVHSPDFGQMITTISGQFYWQDYCLYLLNREGKFVAAFPELPKDVVYWNEENKTLTMTNKDTPPKQFTFKMGDVIYNNGRIIYSKNINMDIESLEDQKCLASAAGIANLGTIVIEKYDMSDK